MKDELKQELKEEITKMVESFLETEKTFLEDPLIKGITADFLYTLKNGVDVKITVGRDLDKDN